MGLNIGSIARDITAFRPTSPPAATDSTRSNTRSSDGQLRAARSASSDILTAGLSPKRSQEEPVQTGFGENTVSPAGAALRTLDVGVRAARESVPTLEEQREELRSRFEELRETQDREPVAAPPPLDITTPRTQAAQRTRDFVNRVNESAGTSQSRLDGRQPEPRVAPASLLINQQVFSFPRDNTPQILDVLI